LNRLSRFSIATLLAISTAQGGEMDLLDMSLILDVGYTDRSISNEDFEGSYVTGFGHAHSEGDAHDHEHPVVKNGFNLNYAEFGISADVDPYWSLNSIFHLSEYSLEIEEAYVTSTFGNGFNLKFGKFYSMFGRLNRLHPHSWNFIDNPLIYGTIFGTHNLLEQGLSISYVPETDFFLVANFELLEGENENSFGKDGFSAGDFEVEEDKNPLISLSLKSSFDVGDLIVLGGLSYLKGVSHISHLDEETPHAVNSDVQVFGAELTLKYLFDSYSYLSWQSEYIGREFDGDFYGFNTTSSTFFKKDSTFSQNGFYSELFYKFNQNYGFGARYSELSENSKIIGGVEKIGDINQNISSLLFEYSTTEFAKFRVQYNHNSALNVGGEERDFDEILFSFNFAVGDHPAHAF
jgi:hypothetical protein